MSTNLKHTAALLCPALTAEFASLADNTIPGCNSAEGWTDTYVYETAGAAETLNTQG